ncbi:DUF4153 domain-containing protein [Sphingomonas sp. MMS12-HWE2-04]|uniref:DUF4153 domain-containing protein n=1 Tax=Sphingomonas sp. MMS12-HWE2-04 TaxID=3234199 RepID=UPI00384FF958
MPNRITSRFTAKAIAAAGLVALGDGLFWSGGGFGSNLGLFAVLWAAATLALAPAAWRDRRSRAAVAAAALFCGALIDDPGLLGFALFWTALTMAVLLPRFTAFDHAGRWLLRLAIHGMASLFGPWIDLARLRRHVVGRAQFLALLRLLPLPLIGGTVFLALFANANPVISDALARIGLPAIDFLTIVRAIFWAILLTLVWGTLRPRRATLRLSLETPQRPFVLPGTSAGSVTLALLTFNALFALQNGLDIAFLWSGAPLPAGVSLAEYAHRGAYPLIVTALLAGPFVLVALRPESQTAAMPAIRRLVVLWIVQNVFLVASSILRTIDYVQVYSLTELRIAALLWMALVAIGLVLVCWRMLRAKSAAWLINANAATALAVLAVCSLVDLGSTAAIWNVRHGREVGGQGASIDLCYLRRLGPSALTALVELQQRPGLAPGFADRVGWVRHAVLTDTLAAQTAGWWTWRDARRLRQVDAMLGGAKLGAPPTGPNGRDCDGARRPPPPASTQTAPTGEPQPASAPAAVAPAQALTNEAER